MPDQALAPAIPARTVEAAEVDDEPREGRLEQDREALARAATGDGDVGREGGAEEEAGQLEVVADCSNEVEGRE